MAYDSPQQGIASKPSGVAPSAASILGFTPLDSTFRIPPADESDHVEALSRRAKYFVIFVSSSPDLRRHNVAAATLYLVHGSYWMIDVSSQQYCRINRDPSCGVDLARYQESLQSISARVNIFYILPQSLAAGRLLFASLYPNKTRNLRCSI